MCVYITIFCGLFIQLSFISVNLMTDCFSLNLQNINSCFKKWVQLGFFDKADKVFAERVHLNLHFHLSSIMSLLNRDISIKLTSCVCTIPLSEEISYGSLVQSLLFVQKLCHWLCLPFQQAIFNQVLNTLQHRKDGKLDLNERITTKSMQISNVYTQELAFYVVLNGCSEFNGTAWQFWFEIEQNC